MRLPEETDSYLGLHEEPLSHSREIGEISAALTGTLKYIKDIHKNTAAFNYKYAPLEMFTPMIRDACIKNNLFVLQSPSSQPGRVGVTTLLTHSSGQWIRGEVAIPFNSKDHKNVPQAAGSIFTYMRRYALGGFFSIASHGDDYDAVEAEKVEQPKKEPVSKASKSLLAKLDKSAKEGKESLTESFAKLTAKEKKSLTDAEVAQFRSIAMTASRPADGN
jgi:hypothetical protein